MEEDSNEKRRVNIVEDCRKGGRSPGYRLMAFLFKVVTRDPFWTNTEAK